MAQNESLTAEQERLSKLIGDWRTAYEAQQSLLQTANNRLHALENDRCNELVKEIRYLKDYISTPGAYGYSEDKVPDLREVLTGYQATLRACYASRL